MRNEADTRALLIDPNRRRWVEDLGAFQELWGRLPGAVRWILAKLGGAWPRSRDEDESKN